MKVKLQFLFELLLILQSGHSVTALVHGKHAMKFFGCTEEEYLLNTDVQKSVVRRLQHYLGAGLSSSSIRYTPPFPVCLIPISHTLSTNQTTVVRFCLINTLLPVPNGTVSPHTLFTDS